MISYAMVPGFFQFLLLKLLKPLYDGFHCVKPESGPCLMKSHMNKINFISKIKVRIR